jgi:tripartite-type tricarboxylate transporter receptor subunit TctC
MPAQGEIVMHRFARIASLLALLCGLTAAPLVHGQAYPSKPIRMIVPLPAGSLTDVVARAVAQGVSEAWGQPVVVDNRAGANGTIGMEACAKAGSDGYTICAPDGNIMTLNPYAYSRLPYDPLEFVPVVHLAELEQSIVVKASLPVKNMKELLDYARAKPGQVTWGSAGAGSTMHLYLEWLQTKTGVRFNHVPYKGPAELNRAMAAGEVEVTNLTTGSIAPHVRSGKVRMIAVVTGAKRTAFALDTPSFASQGFELDFRNWLLLVFPKNTASEPVARWNSEVNRLLNDAPFVQKVMTGQALTPTGGTPQELAAILEQKRRVAADLAKLANLKYD